MNVPFNRPTVVGRELDYIAEAIRNEKLSGDGPFTARCNDWLKAKLGVPGALLTHSCTAALEMAAILCDLQPGDEVIMPSFAFVSSANAVALRGATCVFTDIREDTANLDERLIEEAITDRTKAIFVIDYAGVPAEMDAIARVARTHGLIVVEDSAQALGSTYHGSPAGALGDMGCFSFHETKNVLSGEGGALVMAETRFIDRAEIIREKGTNRRQYLNGFVDKYTWVDIGSSYLPSEIIAAFLLAQFEQEEAITAKRLDIWSAYHDAFAAVEQAGRARRPIIPPHVRHNGHMYYLLLDDLDDREAFIAHMRAAGVGTPFHYVPLHSAPAGKRLGRTSGALPVTDDVSARLVRLPLHYALGEERYRVIDAALAFLRH
ncbi:MAG: dTDP-4-amino-4,6-dideoxygalactose transaminase [Hyphomonadaceae bacterium]